MASLEAKGIVERVASTEFASNVILVAGAKSGSDYRMCANLTDLNARTKMAKYPITDGRSVIDSLQ